MDIFCDDIRNNLNITNMNNSLKKDLILKEMEELQIFGGYNPETMDPTDTNIFVCINWKCTSPKKDNDDCKSSQ